MVLDTCEFIASWIVSHEEEIGAIPSNEMMQHIIFWMTHPPQNVPLNEALKNLDVWETGKSFIYFMTYLWSVADFVPDTGEG